MKGFFKVLLVLLLCYRRVTCVNGAVVTREIAETPPRGEYSARVDSESLAEDRRLNIGDLSPSSQKHDQSNEGSNYEKSKGTAEKFTVNFGPTSHNSVSATYVGSGYETILKSKSQGLEQQLSRRIAEIKASRRLISEMKKRTLATDLSRFGGELAQHYRGIHTMKYSHRINGHTTTNKEIEGIANSDVPPTAEVDTSTTPPLTSLSMFEFYCKEACGQGVGGPECNCPNHPIG